MATRLVVLGLDGATWDVLTPLTASGVMPNLRQLMQDSALVELNSTLPFITPVAWASFQTGCDPHEHGILDYRYYDHRARQLCLNSTQQLQRATLFDALAATGGEVVSLHLPMTYPPPANVAGIVVGGLDSPSPTAALAHVPRFAERLHERGIGLSLKPVWKSVPESYEELSALVAETAQDFRSRAAAACVADELSDWRLMFVQFQTLDALQHRAWHVLKGQCDLASEAKLHEAFHALDAAIGELAELAVRRDARLAVVSDHGFGVFRGKINMPELLRCRGLLTRSRVTHRLEHGFWRAGFRARKWLARRRRPGASTAALTRPLEMLLPIDWRRSRAVALHGDLAGLVYLNTPERFGRGPLTTPRHEEQALAETLAALHEARHPHTGEPLFATVINVRQQLGIDVYQQQWPEIVAIPADGFQTRTRLARGRELLVADPQLTGTHRQQGVLMLPATGRSTARQAEMRDVAPTLLALLGIARPTAMSGRSLVPLDGNLVPEGSRALAGISTPPALTGAQQSLVEARLRDLGYLD